MGAWHVIENTAVRDSGEMYYEPIGVWAIDTDTGEAKVGYKVGYEAREAEAVKQLKAATNKDRALLEYVVAGANPYDRVFSDVLPIKGYVTIGRFVTNLVQALA